MHRLGVGICALFSDFMLYINFRTDSGVHVLRGPVMIHTGVSKYLIDESAESKAEILNEANTILKNINHDPLELLDIHRVSPGFSLRKHVSYRLAL